MCNLSPLSEVGSGVEDIEGHTRALESSSKFFDKRAKKGYIKLGLL